MQVCPGGTARPSGSAQPLARCNHLPGPDIEILHVGIERFLPVPMGQPDIVAVSGSTPGGGHHAVQCRKDWCALLAGKVHAPVEGFFPGKGILPPAIRVRDTPRRRFQREAERLPRLCLFQAGSRRDIFARTDREHSARQQNDQQHRQSQHRCPLISIVFPCSSMFCLHLFALRSGKCMQKEDH